MFLTWPGLVIYEVGITAFYNWCYIYYGFENILLAVTGSFLRGMRVSLLVYCAAYKDLTWKVASFEKFWPRWFYFIKSCCVARTIGQSTDGAVPITGKNN